MSRTDKTRPLWVRIEDPYNRRYVAVQHDHRTSGCDFDGLTAWRSRARHRDQPKCTLKPIDWSAFGEFIARNCGSKCYVCGLAQTYFGERVGRAYWRTLIRKMIKSSPEDIDDMEEITTSAKALRRFQSKHW